MYRSETWVDLFLKCSRKLQPVFRTRQASRSSRLLCFSNGSVSNRSSTILLADSAVLQCKANHIGAITTSSKKERIQGYAAIDTFPDLTPEEVEAISQAGRNCHYRYYNAHVSLPTLALSMTESFAKMVKDFPVPSGSKIMEGPASRAIYPTLQMINQNNNNTDRSFSPDRESYLSDTAVKIDYVIYKKKESLNLERRVNTIHC